VGLQGEVGFLGFEGTGFLGVRGNGEKKKFRKKC